MAHLLQLRDGMLCMRRSWHDEVFSEQEDSILEFPSRLTAS